MTTKRCSACHTHKPLSEYTKNRATKDGLRCYCKECSRMKKTEYEAKKKGESMRYHKFKAIYNGMTTVQKKVYEAIPISEAWDSVKIKNELQRTGGYTENRIMMGCINGLISSGLVKEVGKGFFQREPVTEKAETIIEKEQQKEETQIMPQRSNTDPIEKIANLTIKTNDIMAAIKSLASDIETVAIEVQASFEKQGKDSERLKQLQQLLKGLD